MGKSISVLKKFPEFPSITITSLNRLKLLPSEYPGKVLTSYFVVMNTFLWFYFCAWREGEYLCLIISNNTLFIVNRSKWKENMENIYTLFRCSHAVSAFHIWHHFSISYLTICETRSKFNQINYTSIRERDNTELLNGIIHFWLHFIKKTSYFSMEALNSSTGHLS